MKSEALLYRASLLWRSLIQERNHLEAGREREDTIGI